jgi:membrane protease YdiL (CAAX protease family)
LWDVFGFLYKKRTAMNSFPSIKQSFGIVGIALLMMIVATPFYFIFDNKEARFLLHYLVWSAATIWLVMYWRHKRTGVPTSLDVNIDDPRLLPLILIATVGATVGLIMPLTSLVPMPDFFRNLFIEMSSHTGPLSFVAIVLAAPVMEEILFRGIILEGFLKRYSPAKSIIVSSLLFGALHLNPWQFITGAILGSLAGWIYYRTGSLMMTIIIHVSNNLFVFLAIKLTTNYADVIDQSMIEYYGGVIPFVSITCTALTAGTYAVWALNKMMGTLDRREIIDHES